MKVEDPDRIIAVIACVLVIIIFLATEPLFCWLRDQNNSNFKIRQLEVQVQMYKQMNKYIRLTKESK